jgi:broad specificity phosphatase PhoE
LTDEDQPGVVVQGKHAGYALVPHTARAQATSTRVPFAPIRKRRRARAGYDGTPNESVEDVLVRMRQVLSITETQYDGETVVFVAPDSSVLSVLQAALLGVDLRDHWGLEFRCARSH